MKVFKTEIKGLIDRTNFNPDLYCMLSCTCVKEHFHPETFVRLNLPIYLVLTIYVFTKIMSRDIGLPLNG